MTSSEPHKSHSEKLRLAGTGVLLSVVIPTYNRSALLSRTLPTVFQQSCPPNAYEVIVVVDGSTDDTVEMLRHQRPACGFRIIEQPNLGLPAARNAGLKIAIGRLVVFLDDDLECTPNLIAEHIVAHHACENQVVFGPIFISPNSPPTLAARWTGWMEAPLINRFEREGPTVPLDAHVAPNSSMQRTLLLAHGGFDEKLFRSALEDYDMSYRLWRSGVSFRFHSAAVTHQLYIKSNRELVRGDGPAFGKSEVRLYRKHPDLRRYSQFGRSAEEGMAKRCVKDLAVRFHIPFEWVASIPCWLADCFPGSRFMERIGLRFLSARRTVAVLRSACIEAGGSRNLKREYGLLLPVLLYHHVGPYQPGTARVMTISASQFERQIRWLKRNQYVGILPSDWLAWCRGEKALPEKLVMITFDDAYSDIVVHALPILKRYGYPATVFVVTDQIGGSNAWDQKNGSAALQCMNAEQIKHWAAQGIEFAPHTRSHPDLRTLNEVQLREEIDGSARDLSEILGKRVNAFAYPYGHSTEMVRRQVERTFDLAFTCSEGVNGLATNPYLLRRTMVRSNNNIIDLALYMKRGSSPLNRLRPREQGSGLSKSARADRIPESRVIHT